MPNDSPKGWGWNPSVITLCILIGTLIGGGGLYIGDMRRQIMNIEQQANEAKSKADSAHAEAQNATTIAMSDHPTPTPEPTPKKKPSVKSR